MVYFMGQTWKYNTIFAPTDLNPSIADLFYDAGVEVVAVDWDSDDTHQTIYKQAKLLVLKERPDWIFGYCYGSFVAINSVTPDVAGVFLLDPSSQYSFSEKETSHEDFLQANTNISSNIPPVPLDRIKQPVHIFYTKHADEDGGLRVKYIKNKTIHNMKEHGHKIMMEDGRFKLVEEMLKVMNA